MIPLVILKDPQRKVCYFYVVTINVRDWSESLQTQTKQFKKFFLLFCAMTIMLLGYCISVQEKIEGKKFGLQCISE